MIYRTATGVYIYPTTAVAFSCTAGDHSKQEPHAQHIYAIFHSDIYGNTYRANFKTRIIHR